MKHKGFTLIEMLGVISILALLMLLLVPNILKLFNDMQKRSFELQVKNIVDVAKKEYSNNYFNTAVNNVYFIDTCSDENCMRLDFKGDSKLIYCLQIIDGEVTKLQISNGKYFYKSINGDINITNVIEGNYTIDYINCTNTISNN